MPMFILYTFPIPVGAKTKTSAPVFVQFRLDIWNLDCDEPSTAASTISRCFPLYSECPKTEKHHDRKNLRMNALIHAPLVNTLFPKSMQTLIREKWMVITTHWWQSTIPLGCLRNFLAFVWLALTRFGYETVGGVYRTEELSCKEPTSEGSDSFLDSCWVTSTVTGIRYNRRWTWMFKTVNGVEAWRSIECRDSSRFKVIT